MLVDYFGEKIYEYSICVDEDHDLIIDATSGGYRLSYEEFLILRYILKFRSIYVKIEGTMLPATMKEGAIRVRNVETN